MIPRILVNHHTDKYENAKDGGKLTGRAATTLIDVVADDDYDSTNVGLNKSCE
jgi:hypothetical protein